MNSSANFTETKLTAKIPQREVTKLFDFIKSKLFGIETMYGHLMIQKIEVSKVGSLMKMKFKLKNVFRNQLHDLELVAGDYQL